MKYNEDFLYNQLIKLGDMMGDGLHLEPDGKWIEREYKSVCRALGLIKNKPRQNRSPQINEFMAKRVQAVKCDCGGNLKQTRSGSFIAKCEQCDKKYRLGSRKK